MAFFPHLIIVSTHSRAEAAAKDNIRISSSVIVSTHSRAEAAAYYFLPDPLVCLFQHTAAQRRLHSNKALPCKDERFNTQPRRGGCSLHKKARKISVLNTVFR